MKLASLILVPWVGSVLATAALYPHLGDLGSVIRCLLLILVWMLVSLLLTALTLFIILYIDLRAESLGSIEPIVNPTQTPTHHE